MGCTTSSLAGPNDFKDIDATPSRPVPWRSTRSAPDPVESALSAEAYTHTMPTMTRSDRGAADHALQSPPEQRDPGREPPRAGTLAHMAGLPFTAKRSAQSPEVKGRVGENDFPAGDASGSALRPTSAEPDGMRDGLVVGSPAGKERPKIGEWEAEQMAKARMKAERAKEGQYGNLEKTAGLGRGDEMDEQSLAQGLWKKLKKSGSSSRAPLEGFAFGGGAADVVDPDCGMTHLIFAISMSRSWPPIRKEQFGTLSCPPVAACTAHLQSRAFGSYRLTTWDTEYDPVTGIGKRTGMTKEEIIRYVGSTRGAGLYSDKKYAFVSTGDSGMIS